MPRGGARPGSGPKKGSKNKATLSKEAAREVARQLIMAHLEPMIVAQVAHAKGLKYLVARDKTSGKFEKLTSAQAQAILSGRDTTRVAIEVWEKDPSVQAFTDLMNRALDKPAEQVQTLDVHLKGDDLLRKIAAARARLAKGAM